MGHKLTGVRFVDSEWLDNQVSDTQPPRSDSGWYGVLSEVDNLEEGEQALANNLELSQAVAFYSSTLVNGGLELIIEGRGEFDNKPITSLNIFIADLIKPA